MTLHDWTRVDDGTFHDFHLSWISHLKESLNSGLLPPGYYAQAEQHAGPRIADVLTLQTPGGSAEPKAPDGVAVAPRPTAGLHLTANRPQKGRPRVLAVRHVSGHRIVALVEIVSPSNKDRRRSVQEFVGKVLGALNARVHVTVIDVFPPSRAAPRGLHGALWSGFAKPLPRLPEGKPLTLASYIATDPVEAYVTPLAVGDAVPDVPLFLTPGWHINLPLTSTYDAAFRGIPEIWREVLEAPLR